MTEPVTEPTFPLQEYLGFGRSVIHLRARTIDGAGNLVASATGSFAVITPRTVG